MLARPEYFSPPDEVCCWPGRRGELAGVFNVQMLAADTIDNHAATIVELYPNLLIISAAVLIESLDESNQLINIDTKPAEIYLVLTLENLSREVTKDNLLVFRLNRNLLPHLCRDLHCLLKGSPQLLVLLKFLAVPIEQSTQSLFQGSILVRSWFTYNGNVKDGFVNPFILDCYLYAVSHIKKDANRSDGEMWSTKKTKAFVGKQIILHNNCLDRTMPPGLLMD